MPDLFSVLELIEVAIREEGTAFTFYNAAAKNVDSQDLKEFLLKVAVMEEEHEQKFRDLLKRAGGYAPSGESYSGEYESYMAYLTEGRIFPMGQDAEVMARRQGSDEEVIATAMAMERNSLLFYHEMMRFVPVNDRPLLDDVINEERQHVTDFAKFMAEHR
jgi:rubrerythrin